MKFYIVTTIISIVIGEICWLSLVAELKREGCSKKSKTSVWEELRGWIYFLLPIVNVLFALVALFWYEKLKESVREKWAKEEIL